MAAPVIDSVSPSAITLAPGGTQDVVVVAHDPDQSSGTGNITVTDGQGNTTPVSVAIVVNDPLTFSAGSVSGASNVTVTRIAVSANSATYRFTAS